MKARWLRVLRRFLRAEQGNIAILFGAALVPIVIGTGLTIDYGRAVLMRDRIANAADAAALAVGSWQGLTPEERQAKAQEYFEANYPPGSLGTIATINVSTDGADTTVSITGDVETYFLRVVGIDSIDVGAQSVVTASMGTLEVAMVLDLSGSMNQGGKMQALREAASNLTNTLFDLAASSTKPDPIKIGLVPFAGSVNVGPQHANAPWMDTDRLSPVHGDNFEMFKNVDPTADRPNLFTLFNRISNASWAGCVEEHPMPHQIQDTPPTTANPVTLFVPLFAPDEPDNLTCSGSTCSSVGSGFNLRYNGAPTGNRTQNNYLPDAGGSCGSSNSNWTCNRDSDFCTQGIRERVNFARTLSGSNIACKYGSSNNAVSAPNNLTVAGIPGGPNFWCTTPPLTPLTDNQSTILSTIDDYQAQGATNILAGVMWGWRLLSPTEPFTQGRPYNAEHNQKVIVLMTDGENTYYPRNNALRSWFGAFGYLANPNNRLDAAANASQSTLTGIMNDRTKQACANAKAQGIIIYSVAFDIIGSDANNEQAALEVMQDCASDPDKYFAPGSNQELLQAFHAIGHDISQLRVAE